MVEKLLPIRRRGGGREQHKRKQSFHRRYYALMRTWLQTLRRGVKYRVTRGGFLFTLAIALIGAAAVASANNLLFLIVATMLSVLLISSLVSRLGLAGLELAFVLPEHVSAGRGVAATLA